MNSVPGSAIIFQMTLSYILNNCALLDEHTRMSFPLILSSLVSLSSKLLEAGQFSPHTMQVLQQRVSDSNDYQIHLMNYIQSKDGSITQGKKSVSNAGKCYKGN